MATNSTTVSAPTKCLSICESVLQNSGFTTNVDRSDERQFTVVLDSDDIEFGLFKETVASIAGQHNLRTFADETAGIMTVRLPRAAE